MPHEVADPLFLKPPRSAYIHVPFCVHRCGYCDFTLVAWKDRLIPDYLRALDLELQSVSEPVELDTLYFGGGTPSHLSPEELAQLFEIVFSRFRLADGAECTLEANPVDLNGERIESFLNAGVNRISLGVQSFDPQMLSILERDHSAETIVAGMNLLRGKIENVSLDLIFGVPGQSLELWTQTLEQALELQPTHLSTYGLTFEKGTEFWNRRERGALAQVSDDLERELYALTIERLTESGFEHYEISSFAKPGLRSRHNQVYWTGAAYHAFGPGASRYRNGVRETNHRSVTTWLNKVLAGKSGVMEAETLSAEDRARERLILGLRRIEGIEVAQFELDTGYSLDELAEAEIDRAINRELLEVADGNLRLTSEGRFHADGVIVDLL